MESNSLKKKIDEDKDKVIKFVTGNNNYFNMRDSNTLLYIIVTIVILHFLVGLIFLAYKLLGPVKNRENTDKKPE